MRKEKGTKGRLAKDKERRREEKKRREEKRWGKWMYAIQFNVKHKGDERLHARVQLRASCFPAAKEKKRVKNRRKKYTAIQRKK